MFSKIKRFLNYLWNGIKAHPIITLICLFFIVIGGTLITYEVMHYTSSPSFCQKCHPEEGTGALSEYHTWSQNIHAFANVECLDCHSPQPGAWGYLRAKVQDGLYDLVMEFVLSDEAKLEKLSEFEDNPERSAQSVSYKVCMHCHSDSVNEENLENHWMTFFGVPMRGIDTVRNPEFRMVNNLIDIENDEVRAGVAASHSLHLALDITCSQCHEKVSHSGQFMSKLDMQTCFTCHDEQREMGGSPVENDDCETCHVNNVAMQEGTILNGKFTTAVAEWSGKYSSAPAPESNRWNMRDLGCEGCHEDAFHRPTPESCISCHDEDYAMIMVAWQEEFDEMDAEAFEFLITNMPDRDNMSDARRHIFNEYENLYKMIAKDGSRGVHNNDYMVKLFDRLAELREKFHRTF